MKDHLRDARTRKWITHEEAASLLRLNGRAIGATTGLLKYLDSCKGKAPTGWDVVRSEPDEPAGQSDEHEDDEDEQDDQDKG